MAISLMIVDDDSIVREMLPSYFDSEEFTVVSVLDSAYLVPEVLSEIAVDIVLTDIRLPGMDGIDLVRTLKKNASHIPVVGITSFDEDEYVVEMLRAGAAGIVLKSASRETILMALREAVAGRVYVAPALAGKIGRYLSPFSETCTVQNLSDREQEVLDFLLEGMTNEEIAQELYISVATVKKHLSSLMKKYDVTSRLKLVLAALR